MASRLRQLCPILQRCAEQASSLNRPFSTHSDCIQVTPKVSLFDQKVHVKVHGLPSTAKVTLHAVSQQEWRRQRAVFRSCGHFLTSEAGDLDLQRDASVGGTYTGLDPMGPFWSLQPCPSGPQNIRMVLKNMDQPVLYNLSLYLGHWSLDDLVAKETTLTPLYSTVVSRLKMAGDVRRIPVKEGNVRGMLFLPPGEGPHPGVIDMFGSAGGLIEVRAALLASHGFAALALPFFRYQDLPQSLEDITWDYFQEAAVWLSSHAAVKAGGVGVVGVSTGAMLAQVMAWKCPQVKAVVLINGLPFLGLYDLLHKDGTLVQKAVRMDLGQANPTAEGLSTRHCYPHTADHFIPAWEGNSRILALVSDDDEQVDPTNMDGFYSAFPEEKRHLLEVVHYPGAGHLLEPPYTPHCRFCTNPTFGIEMLWGGNPVNHAAAQEDSWQRILFFLQTHLS